MPPSRAHQNVVTLPESNGPAFFRITREFLRLGPRCGGRRSGEDGRAENSKVKLKIMRKGQAFEQLNRSVRHLIRGVFRHCKDLFRTQLTLRGSSISDCVGYEVTIAFLPTSRWARRVICSGNGPNGRLKVLGQEAVLLRWPVLLARVGVPARIEEPPPLSPHRWQARSSGARPSVGP
jgi:hypothetical protein